MARELPDNTDDLSGEVSEGEEFTIEVVDDRDSEDRRDVVADSDIPDDDGEPTDEELQAISGRVKKRIDNLTFKYNNERRRAEAASKLQEEAVRFAEKTREENMRMRSILEEGETVLLAAERDRTKALVDKAMQQHALALESGDPAEISKAQMALNRAQIEQHQAERITPSAAPVQPQGQAPVPQGQVPQQPQNAQPPQQQVVDPDFESWREKNQWFDSDAKMRAYAIALHQEIKNNEQSTGVLVGSDAYYNQIDSTMKAAFPTFFRAEGTSEPAASPAPPVVAPVSRANGADTKPRKVQLTETQVDLAKRLGLTPEVYARELIKLGAS